MFKIKNITHHYLAAALWSTMDEHGEPLDAVFSVDDVCPTLYASAFEDCEDFVTANQTLLLDSGLSEEQIGHDFWLTRNGHGAGFWDRGLGAIGDELTALAYTYGEVNIYAGDDGWIYC